MICSVKPLSLAFLSRSLAKLAIDNTSCTFSFTLTKQDTSTRQYYIKKKLNIDILNMFIFLVKTFKYYITELNSGIIFNF